MKGYADLHKLPEDQRVTVIGKTLMAMESGKTIAVCFDEEGKDGYEKLERYKDKILAWFSEVEFVRRDRGPVKNVVMATFKRK